LKLNFVFGLFLLMSILLLQMCNVCVFAADNDVEKAVFGNLSSVIAVPIGHSHLINTPLPIIRASISEPKIADVNVISANQVLVIAKSEIPRSTTLILWHNKGFIQTFDIHVYQDISPLLLNQVTARLKEIAPFVNVKLLPAITANGKERVVLSGEVVSQEVMDRVLWVLKAFNLKFANLIKIKGPQQVQLKVVVAEISKSGTKQMGINFLDMGANMGVGVFKGGDTSMDSSVSISESMDPSTRVTWGPSGSGYTYSSSDGGSGASSSASSTNSVTSPFASAFQIAINSSKHSWLSLLSLLKSQGLAKALATPTLVTMNGQAANFQVGGEYPIPVQGEKGGITIERVQYGIILSFTPYIIDEETITLVVSPEVSAPDFSLGVTSGGVTVPGQTTRKGKSTLQLKDGQSFAMAGLLNEEAYVTVNKIPFLGDIPYLGTLFTSKETKHNETELVIMVTPTFVRPLDKDEVPQLPGQDTENSIGDIDFFLENRLNLPEKKQPQARDFRGNRGFSK